MDTRDLEAVVAIAEEGSFTAAAQRLLVAQPAISRQLARLERRLGYRLFDRTSRGAMPTPACERLLLPMRAALDALTEVESASREAQAASTTVRLGAGFGIAPQLVIDASRCAITSGLRLTVIRDGSRGLVRRMLEGDLDVALLATSVHQLDRSIHARWLEPEAVVATVPLDDPMPDRISLPDLLAWPVLLLGPASGIRDTLSRLPSTHVLRIAAEADDPALLFELALAQAGVLLLPASVAKEAPSGLRTVELTDSPLRHHPALAWPKRTRVSAPLAHFREAFAELGTS
jgi:DNA-binding transcriptional LysR family regulator